MEHLSLSYQSSRKPWDFQKSDEVLGRKEHQLQFFANFSNKGCFRRMIRWGHVINIDKKCRLVYTHLHMHLYIHICITQQICKFDCASVKKRSHTCEEPDVKNECQHWVWRSYFCTSIRSSQSYSLWIFSLSRILFSLSLKILNKACREKKPLDFYLYWGYLKVVAFWGPEKIRALAFEPLSFCKIISGRNEK